MLVVNYSHNVFWSRCSPFFNVIWSGMVWSSRFAYLIFWPSCNNTYPSEGSFNRFSKAGLILNPKKYNSGKKNVRIPGLEFSSNGVSPVKRRSKLLFSFLRLKLKKKSNGFLVKWATFVDMHRILGRLLNHFTVYCARMSNPNETLIKKLFCYATWCPYEPSTRCSLTMFPRNQLSCIQVLQ